ncbi:MAG: hypothetical protein OXU69_12360 [Gemmatimonadota bacterium]|nr:hypothetical protein [Gemmatimonadota bacterium]MDE2985490.1 hypothetical protein [Gemmatimonadota bacterium]
MAHLIGLRGSQGGVRALVGVAIGLSLILGITVEAAHAHDATELAAVCSVCTLPYHGAPASTPGAPVVIPTSPVAAPALPGHRLIPGIVHLLPYQSRAPPLPISL